jgi:hypothetical protein
VSFLLEENTMKTNKSNRELPGLKKTKNPIIEPQALTGVDVRKQELQKVEAVLSYDDGVDFGIGYQQDTGKLVEFKIPKVGLLNPAPVPIELTEITLADSLEWAEKMLYAQKRMNLCIQTGPALDTWFNDLRFSLENE